MKKAKYIALNILSIVLLTLCSTPVFTNQYAKQQQKSLFDSDTRKIVQLNDGWKFSRNGEGWTSTNLPFTTKDNAVIYFEKNIELNKSAIENYIWELDFLGVLEEVEVSINGRSPEKYFGGGGSFVVPLNEKYLQDGVNTVRLKVYPISTQNSLAISNHIYSPVLKTGITQSVFLIGKPRIWIEDFSTQFDSGKGNQITGKLSIGSKMGDYIKTPRKTNLVSNDSLEIEDATQIDSLGDNNLGDIVYIKSKILNSNGEIVSSSVVKRIEIEPERTISLELQYSPFDIKLWSPKQPNLYTIETSISDNVDGEPIDVIRKRIGNKKVEIINNEIYLNDELFISKGVNYILPNVEGEASLPDLLENDINNIKGLGANLILFNKEIPHPYLVSLCDKYGILILSDLPIDGIPGKILSEDNIKVRTRNITERIVDKYKANVSLLGIGIHSNIASDSYSSEFSDFISGFVRENTDILLYSTIESVKDTRFDVDFYTYRIPSSDRDFGKITNNIISLTNNVDKPLMVRYGVAVRTEYLYGWEDQQSEEYQGHYLKNIYTVLKSQNSVGSIIDYYRDYELINPLLNVRKDNLYSGTLGLVSADGSEKVAYKVIKAFYNDEKQPLISAGEPKTNHPITFTIISILLIIVVLMLLNRYRRFRDYFMRSLLRPYNFYSDIRDQRIMSTARTFIIGFIVSSSMALFISALIFNFRTSETLQTLLMLLIPSKPALEFIVKISWQPLLMFLFFTSVFFLLMFLIAFILKFFSIFSKYRVELADTLTITIWSAIPFLVMLPITMVIPKLLDFGEVMVLATVCLGLLLGLWIFLRILNSSSVVMDKPIPLVYLVGIAFLLIVFVTPLLIYQTNYSFLDYLGFFADTRS